MGGRVILHRRDRKAEAAARGRLGQLGLSQTWVPSPPATAPPFALTFPSGREAWYVFLHRDLPACVRPAGRSISTQASGTALSTLRPIGRSRSSAAAGVVGLAQLGHRGRGRAHPLAAGAGGRAAAPPPGRRHRPARGHAHQPLRRPRAGPARRNASAPSSRCWSSCTTARPAPAPRRADRPRRRAGGDRSRNTPALARRHAADQPRPPAGGRRGHPIELPAPDGFVAELRPYQRAGSAGCSYPGARAGRNPGRRHGARQDDRDPGAYQVEQNAGRLDRPALVICPTSVVANWESEAARFAPSLRVLRLHGRGEAFGAVIAMHDLVVDLRAAAARCGSAVAGRMACGRARRVAGDQEPGDQSDAGRLQAEGAPSPLPDRHAGRESSRRAVVGVRPS